MATETVDKKAPGIGVIPAGISLAVTLVAGYVVCWLTLKLAGPSAFAHSWLSLFSAKPIGSVDQLLEGSLYSALSAWFAVLVFAPVYNLIAKADRLL